MAEEKSIIKLIPDALEYYDQNAEKYKKFLSKITKYKIIEAPSDLEHNKIALYDKNEQELIVSDYEVLGMYNHVNHMWFWGWAVSSFRKNLTFISRKILTYAFDLNPAIYLNLHLKTELITSRFIITNPIQLDLHISLASYLSKSPVIYKYILRADEKNPDDYVIYYLILLNHDKIKT
jgi:hypothetical protein